MRLKSGLVAVLVLLVAACGGGGGGSNGGGNSLAAPGQLILTATGQDQITLTWTAPSGGCDGYELEASIGTDPFEKVHAGLIPNTYTGLSLTFSATAPDNTTYKFRLRAARGTSFSSYSDEATYSRGPNTPTGATASYDWNTSSVILTWTRNTTGSDGLTIERAECSAYGSQNGGWTALAVTDPLASTFADNGISPNLYYTYRISNRNGSRSSQPSTPTQPVYTGLASIAWVNAYYDSNLLGVQVSWSSSTPVPDSVRLERTLCDANGMPLGNWTLVNLPAGYQTSFLDQAPQEGGIYAYRAANIYGQTASIPYQMYYGVTVPLLAPINLQVTAAPGGLQLTWQNRSVAANQVVIRRTPYTGFSPDLAILSPGTTGYLDPATSLGYYTYTVVAKNNNLETSSNPVAGATPNPPDALALTASVLNYPNAVDAAIRATGSWAFATASPFGVLSNTDPWPAFFPGNASRWSTPILQVDRQGWPHALYASPSTTTTGESALNHMWYDGSGWKTETVASAKIPWNSANSGWTFQLDSTGNPHVLLDHTSTQYPSDGSTSTLSYLHKVSGAWSEEPLSVLSPSVNNIGTYHIRLEDSDTPHLLIGNWSSVLDYARTGPGTWTSSTLPTGTVNAGWYDFLDGIWVDTRNGWVFYEGYVNGNGLSYGLYVIQMKDGVWLPAELLGARGHDGASTTAQAAVSPDRTRAAIVYNTSAGIKAFHQTATGWHKTLVAPYTGGYPLLRIGFDGNQKVHILTATTAGFVDYHE